MGSTKTVIKNAALLTASLGAIVGGSVIGHGAALEWALIPQVVGHLFTHIGTKSVEPLSKEIIKHLNAKDPGKLNHDLQKTLISSLLLSCDSIKISYKAKFNTPPDEKMVGFLKGLKEKLEDELAPAKIQIDEKGLREVIYSNEKEGRKEFLATTPDNNILLDLLNHEIENSGTGDDFKLFFKENFLRIVQLHFTEALKAEKNIAARTAFQKMLSEETLLGVNKILDALKDSKQNTVNQEWLREAGKLPKDKIDRLEKLVQELNKPGKLEIAYSEALDKRFELLNEQYKLLHQDIITTKTNVLYIKDYLLKHIWIAYAVAALAIIISTIIVVKNYYNPFNVVFTLTPDASLDISKEYPALSYPVKLTLRLPGKTETAEVNASNEVSFVNIDKKYYGQKAIVTIEDPFWRCSGDTIELSENRQALKIEPNESLSWVTGTVKNRSGNIFIESAAIKIGTDTIIYSDYNGNFKAHLPFKMRKKEYLLTISKSGYGVETTYYAPLSNEVEIRLNEL